MDPLNLADAFVTFFAVLGPQKVLLSVAQMARTRDTRAIHLVEAYAAIVAACVGGGLSALGVHIGGGH